MTIFARRNTITILAFIFLTLTAFQSYAKTASELYDEKVSKHANVKEIVFRDDDTDVAGRAYDFTKSVLNWAGIPSPVLDAADFARSVKNEGLNSSNTLTLMSKIAVNKLALEKIGKSIKNMKNSDLKKLAEKLKISEAKGDLRKNILELATETAPASGGLALEDERTKARNLLMIDVITKFCKTCDVAHKGFKLAKEAAKAADIVFDNAKTQSMFAKVKVAGFYDLKAFKEEFVGAEGLKDGARKALTKLHKSRNLSPPTDDEVMKYIFHRYQRWRIEVKERKNEAEILKAIKGEYLKLAGYQTEKMFGDIPNEQRISRFQDEYIKIYNDIFSYKGDKPRPFGLSLKAVRWHILQLLKKKLTGQLTSEEFEYEKRKLLAKWGWLDKSKVGNPPTKPKPIKVSKPPVAYKPSKERLHHIATRLQRLNYKKLMRVMDYIHVQLPDSFMLCLCRVNPAGTGSVGYIKTPRKDCPGPCTGGVINCVSWSPRAGPEDWKNCMGSVHMPDGTRIDDYIAKSLPGARRAVRK